MISLPKVTIEVTIGAIDFGGFLASTAGEQTFPKYVCFGAGHGGPSRAIAMADKVSGGLGVKHQDPLFKSEHFRFSQAVGGQPHLVPVTGIFLKCGSSGAGREHKKRRATSPPVCVPHLGQILSGSTLLVSSDHFMV